MAAETIVPARSTLADAVVIAPGGHMSSAAIVAFRIGTGAAVPVLFPHPPKGAIICLYDPETRQYSHPDGRQLDRGNLYQWAEEVAR